MIDATKDIDECFATPLVIARLQARDHANGAPGAWWAEYRVRELSEAERYAIAQRELRSAVPVFVLEQRYCHEQDSEYCTVHKGAWEAWDYGQTALKAVMSCAGDSRYVEAESLHPMHEAMIEHFKAGQARDKRIEVLRELTHYRRRDTPFLPVTWAEVNVRADERDKANQDFERELKAAKLWSKASKGEAPQDKVDAIKAVVRERYEERLKVREEEHRRLMEELRMLEAQSK